MTVDRFYEGQAGADARRSAPAAQRNREPIAEVLGDWLPNRGLVLEIASGTGEHAVYFAQRYPALSWQPTDLDEGSLRSIAAWRETAGLPNVRAPILLDASAPAWPVERADAVLSNNMAHISPWAASLGLIAGSAQVLPSGGPLILYGPWLKDDIETVQSNRDFDADLRRRNSEWGLRRVENFAEAADASGLALDDYRRMPANNLMLLFRKR